MAPPTQVATLGTSRLSLPVYLHKQGHLSHIDDLEAANHVPYFREYKTIFFFPSPWVPTYTIDTTYLSFFQKKIGKKSCF